MGTDSPQIVDALGALLVPEHGTVEIDSKWQTAAERVYACGDATRGASLVVWAIAEGRACAAAVDDALIGLSDLPRPVEPHAVAL